MNPTPAKPAISFSDPQTNMLAWSRRNATGLLVPDEADPRFVIGYSVAPAYGAANQVQLVTYTPPAGYQTHFCEIVLGFSGTGPAPNLGDVNFSVDVDRPLGSTSSGYTMKDYASIPLPLGAAAPYEPCLCDFLIKDQEVLRVKAYTVANMGTGVGNYLFAILRGYEWPKGKQKR